MASASTAPLKDWPPWRSVSFGTGQILLIIVFEPTGLVWLVAIIYLKARHPDCRLVSAKTQKVAVLRKYLRGRSESDRIDTVTLAKTPFVDR